jgi:hypothetical protein
VLTYITPLPRERVGSAASRPLHALVRPHRWPGTEGEAGSPVTAVSLPGRRVAAGARRAGLEFVENLLPTKLTSTDTTERNTRHAPLWSRPVASMVEDGRSGARLALVHRSQNASLDGDPDARAPFSSAIPGRSARPAFTDSPWHNRFHKARRPGSIEDRCLHCFPPQR